MAIKIENRMNIAIYIANVELYAPTIKIDSNATVTLPEKVLSISIADSAEKLYIYEHRVLIATTSN